MVLLQEHGRCDRARRHCSCESLLEKTPCAEQPVVTCPPSLSLLLPLQQQSGTLMCCLGSDGQRVSDLAGDVHTSPQDSPRESLLRRTAVT